MLVRFIVENFRSFNYKNELLMIAGSYKRLNEHVFTSSSGLELLRSSAIYGANGSGKTNLIKALAVLQKIVTSGPSDPKSPLILPYFKLDKASKNLPTKFEIEFINKGIRYSYSISILHGRIIQEWLYILKGKNEVINIFERTNDGTGTNLKFGAKKKYGEEDKIRQKIYKEILRENQSFLSSGHSINIEELKDPYDWFEDKLTIISHDSKFSPLIHWLASKPSFLNFTKQIINKLTIGISDIEVESVPVNDFFGDSDKEIKEKIVQPFNSTDEATVGGINFTKNEISYSAYKNANNDLVIGKIVTKHFSKGEDVTFDLFEESDGTQRILDLLPAILLGMSDDNVFVIDEIESSIHPVIIKELVKLFLIGGKGRAGQLIFTTHECNLLDLDLLRQDEIWFMEKNETGESSLYSLSNFKPRFDKDIRKGYLEGQFSKIPFLSHPLTLNWQ